jgi:hypothetical protein
MFSPLFKVTSIPLLEPLYKFVKIFIFTTPIGFLVGLLKGKLIVRVATTEILKGFLSYEILEKSFGIFLNL